MGQYDILDLLQKHKKYLSSKEIAEKLGVRTHTIPSKCKVWHRLGLIDRKAKGREYYWRVK